MTSKIESKIRLTSNLISAAEKATTKVVQA